MGSVDDPGPGGLRPGGYGLVGTGEVCRARKARDAATFGSANRSRGLFQTCEMLKYVHLAGRENSS